MAAIIRPGTINRFYMAPSEANAVVERFNSLSESDKQSILDFLRSL